MCVNRIYRDTPDDIVEILPEPENFSVLGFDLTGLEPIDISIIVPISTNGVNYNSAVVCFITGSPAAPRVEALDPNEV